MSFSPAGHSRLTSDTKRPARASSPPTEDYQTASSFDPQHEALNSTFAFNHTLTQQLPHIHRAASMLDAGEEDTNGSAEMSIEIGRGGRGAGRQDDYTGDQSWRFSNADDLYNLTPSMQSRQTSTRKGDGMLRREASIRKASEVAKPNASVKRTASAALPRQTSLREAVNQLPDDSQSGGDVTRPSRNTRFVQPKNVLGVPKTRVLSGSTLEGSNGESGYGNKAKTSAVEEVSESFAIPDMDGATHLFSGTPAMPRSNKRGSRFTPSTTYRMPSRSATAEYRPIQSIPLDRDAERVYDGINEAVARIAQLELEKDRLREALEEREFVISDLRSALEVEEQTHRPDSGLGSEDEGAKVQWRRERAQLQVQIKTLQDMLAKSERQARTHEATVLRVTQERMETKRENEVFRDNYQRLLDENRDLRAAISEKGQSGRDRSTRRKPVRAEVEETASQIIEQLQKSKTRFTRPSQSSREAEPTQQPVTVSQSRDITLGQLDQNVRDKITEFVLRELEKVRDGTTGASRMSRQQKAEITQTSMTGRRQLSHGSERRTSVHTHTRRSASDPVEAGASEGDLESDDELIERTRDRNQDTTKTTNAKIRAARASTRDIDLTDLSVGVYATEDLRRMLELQRRPNGAKRHASLPMETEKEATAIVEPRRKSSMRDIASDLTGRVSHTGDNDTTRLPKTVRLQSPQTGDSLDHPTVNATKTGNAIDVSLIGNTPRRRRQSSFMAEQTSAFILADITLHNPLPTPLSTTIPPHAAETCTICPSANDASIPYPIAVSLRPDLPEDATLRPAWPPHKSLAHVVKQLQDELQHLHIQLRTKTAELRAHDPALGRRRRVDLEADIESLSAEIARRGEVVYRLFDVVEAHKDSYAGVREHDDVEEEVEESVELGRGGAEEGEELGRFEEDTDCGEGSLWEGISDAEV